MTITSLLAHLQNAKRTGDGWMASCPAHEDTEPSLSLTEKDGKILFKCFGGCSQEEVLNALRRSGAWTNGAPLWQKSTHEKCTEIWQETLPAPDRSAEPLRAYLNRRGLRPKSLPDSIRFHPGLKHSETGTDFPALVAKISGRDGKGIGLHRIYVRKDGSKPAVSIHKKALGKIKGGAIRLDEPEETLHLAEGLETALAVREAIGTATWSAVSAPGLKAVIIPAGVQECHIWADLDRSGAGQRAAEDLAQRIDADGKTVYVHLPEGPIPEGRKSVDWLDVFNADGPEPIRLESLTAEPYEPPKKGLELTPLSALLTEPDEAVDWIVADHLPAGGQSILAGKPKAGKSTLARWLCLAVARGESWLGMQTRQGRVLYLALEEKRSEVRRHFRRMGATVSDDVYVYVAPSPADGLEQLRQAAAEYQPVLIVIDPLFKFARVKDGNDYAAVTAALEPVLTLARQSGAHLMAVHYLGKGERAGGDGVLGSTAIFASVDTLLLLKRSDRYRTLSSIQRYGTDLEETVLNLDEATEIVEAAGSRQDADERTAGEAILEFLQGQDQPIDEKTIRENVEGRKQLLIRGIRRLLDEGKIARIGSGKRGDPYLYSVSGSLVPHIYREPENQESNFGSTHCKNRTYSGSSQN